VDENDIKIITFDIFSKRKRFNYDCYQRINLYFGFMGEIFRCRTCKFDRMNLENKLFEIAKDRLNHECDITEVMDEVRRSRIFQRDFLTEQQKILLKFDNSNVIRD